MIASVVLAILIVIALVVCCAPLPDQRPGQPRRHDTAQAEPGAAPTGISPGRIRLPDPLAGAPESPAAASRTTARKSINRVEAAWATLRASSTSRAVARTPRKTSLCTRTTSSMPTDSLMASTSELVGGLQARLVPVGQVPEHQRRVVECEAGPGRHSSAALRPEVRLPPAQDGRHRRPSSRSRAVRTKRHLHRQAHERHGDLRRDADHHRLGTAQPGHVGEISQGARGERVEHVDRSDVDQDAAGPLAAHPVEQVLLQARQLLVVERGVDGDDEVRPLGQDGRRQRGGRRRSG